MAATDTVISLKESFLRTQVRLLSQPLQPSRNWRDRAPVPEQGELKEKVVQEVLYKRMYPSSLEGFRGGLTKHSLARPHSQYHSSPS